MGYDPSGPNRSDEKSHKVPPMLASSRDIRSERMKKRGEREIFNLGLLSIGLLLAYYWFTIDLQLHNWFTIA